MKSLLTVIALAVGLVPFATAESATNDAYVGSAEQGKAKSVTCSACHGSDGNSGAADYPKLAGQHASYLASTLRAYRDGLRKNAIMAGLAAVLSEEDIADLSVYYATQTISTGAVQADLLDRGEQLYRFGDTEKGISACAACHGPTGVGLASAVFPSLKGQWAGYSETQLRAFRDGLRVNVMMNGVAQKMSDADIEAVSSYVEGLK
ncbi:MAG TPA: cytochrome c4 [Gammaproteobacteria bacterium]|nr:cytochrome c4 [Gammaproteobacteria bacterium]HBX26396.1 cytochrome c4 [Gammaproteobacteria bacterium]|tara:strand:+ start:4 stop:621 length:618 start_codon:yes stop_codon:yes gene_type:complete